MGKKIKLDPVPDVNTHDFTIYALNEIYENLYKIDRDMKKIRRGSRLRFIIGMTIGYYALENLRNKFNEEVDKTDH